jgi:hypothetical protein
MTQTQWLLLPLFIHLALLSYVGIRSLFGRISSVSSGKTRLKEIALDTSKWPDEVRKFSNNFNNQFEVPTYWYALTGILIATGKVDQVEVALSWLFIAARIIHTLIHTGGNNVRLRTIAFLSSFAALNAMWIWFGIRLFLIG